MPQPHRCFGPGRCHAHPHLAHASLLPARPARARCPMCSCTAVRTCGPMRRCRHPRRCPSARSTVSCGCLPGVAPCLLQPAGQHPHLFCALLTYVLCPVSTWTLFHGPCPVAGCSRRGMALMPTCITPPSACTRSERPAGHPHRAAPAGQRRQPAAARAARLPAPVPGAPAAGHSAARGQPAPVGAACCAALLARHHAWHEQWCVVMLLRESWQLPPVFAEISHCRTLPTQCPPAAWPPAHGW